MATVARQVVLVFASFVLHFLHMGIPQSFGVIYSELVSVFEVGEGQIGWVASLFTGMLLGTGVVSGVVVTTLGMCLTTVAGSLLMTVGMVSSAFVSNPYLLYVTYGLTAGFGATLVMIVANVTVVSKEFKDRRTIAIGVASTGGGIGNIVIPHFTSWCIDMYDWRGCFILMGGICLQGVVIGALLYSEKQSDTDIETQKLETTKPCIKMVSQKCKELFSFFNAPYICCVIATVFGFVAYFIPFNLLYNMMIVRGQTKEYSSLALSLAGVGSIVSRLLVGFVGDYNCCHRIYYYIFAMFLSGIITIACVHLTVFWQFLLYGLLYGMGTGIFAVLLSVITADLVGLEHIGPALGFMLTASGLSASIGTPAGGWLVDATGSYNSSFYFSGAFCLASGLVASVIPVMWRCTRQSGHASVTEPDKPEVELYTVSHDEIFVTEDSLYQKQET